MHHVNENLSKISEILIMPYSHADFAWTNTRQWHIWRYLQGFNDILDLMKDNSDITWIIDNVIHSLIPFIKYCPDRVEELKQRIREGRVYVANGGYSLARPTYVGEESYIRNLVEGKRFLQRFSGQETIDFFYNADTAGGHSQLPQILQLSGHRYYRFLRPEGVLNHKGIPKQFVWKGLDGSEVIVSRGNYGGFMYAHYTNQDFNTEWESIREEFFKEELKERVKLLPSEIIFLNHGCDDFRPLHNLFDKPIRLLEFMDEWNKRENQKMSFSTPGEYFGKLQTMKLPLYQGVLEQCEITFNTPIRGELSMWRLRQQLDRLIVKAECLCTLASFYGMEYPAIKIEHLWKSLFEITGHAIEWVLAEDYENLRSAADGAVSVAKSLIGEATDYTAQMTGIGAAEEYVLFNMLGQARSEVVKIHVTSSQGVNPFALLDETGKRLEYQVIDVYMGDKAYCDCDCNAVDVLAEVEIPSMGFKVLRTVEDHEEKSYLVEPYLQGAVERERNCSADRVVIDNGCYMMVMEKGRIVSISDRSGRSFGDTNRNVDGINAIRFVKTIESQDWVSNWKSKSENSFVPERWKVLKNGPLQWEYVVAGTVGEHTAEQRITINKGERAVNFEITIDSVGGEGYFIADFPSDTGTPLHVDVPFGVETRDLTLEIVSSNIESKDEANLVEQGWKGQFYGKNWAAFRSGGMPAAIVSGNCSIYYNHDIDRNMVSLLLNRLMPLDRKSNDRQLRWIKQTHSSIEGKGKHIFKYSLFLPETEGKFADIAKFSKQKAMPVEVVPRFNRWSLQNGPLSASFIECSADNVIVSAFYKENGAFILRLYETEGRETDLSIILGFEFMQASIVDLMGERTDIGNLDVDCLGRRLKMNVKPWQIVNLRIE